MTDFVKLKRGVRPRDMDDRWIFQDMTDEELLEEEIRKRMPANKPTEPEIMTDDEFWESIERDEAAANEPKKDPPPVDLDQGGNISIRRSWTNKENYRLILIPREGGVSAKIEAITWDKEQVGHITEEQAKLDAVLLCRSIAGCELAAAPDYEPHLFSARLPRSATADKTTVENGTDPA